MNEFKCGCKTNGFMIEYCPKHGAADDMYELIRQIRNADLEMSQAMQVEMEIVLRKAEGKE